MNNNYYLYVYRGKHNKRGKNYISLGGNIMARTSRNNMKNSSFFHVMVQGINKEKIFETRKNKEEYLKLISENSNNLEILYYCIMDNHAHMLVYAEDIVNIGTWMKKSNTSYAIYYNKNNGRVGYVFRDRYKIQPIMNEKHLFLCIDYIHDNPVKAGICTNKGEYEFSSYTKIYGGNQTNCKKRLENFLSRDIHCNEDTEEEFELIEDIEENKEEKCVEIINKFLKDNNMDLFNLINQKGKLKELIKFLKYDNNISYREIERNLKISREKIRKLIL